MRLHRTIPTTLTLIALALALTSSPAVAGVRDCKMVFATLDTTFVENYVEIGELEGLLNGATYLRYDDAAPAINPKLDPPNLVISTKTGAINLWVYSESKPDGGDNWWRDFTTLRAQGTGAYANQRIILEVYGKCSLKGGSYEIEGWICSPLALPPKK